MYEMEKIRVMITDDHSLIREGLKQLLEFDGSIEVVGEASNGVECLDKLNECNPEVLLLDINMPEKNGIEVLKQMKTDQSQVKVLILTVHNEMDYLMKAVDIGVDGYILKDSESSELKKAIRAVRDGENYIQPSLIPAMNSQLLNRDTDKDKLSSLTNRELEVLVQVANGMFNKEIATNLNISERTVKNHISSIFRKINVWDRTQAAVFAIRNRIVELD